MQIAILDNLQAIILQAVTGHPPEKAAFLLDVVHEMDELMAEDHAEPLSREVCLAVVNLALASPYPLELDEALDAVLALGYVPEDLFHRPFGTAEYRAFVEAREAQFQEQCEKAFAAYASGFTVGWSARAKA